MTRDDLWQRFLARNPRLQEGYLTPAGARKLFEVTWAAAYEAGWEAGRTSEVAGLGRLADLMGMGGRKKGGAR